MKKTTLHGRTLVLKTETLIALHDDALRDIRGGNAVDGNRPGLSSISWIPTICQPSRICGGAP